MAPPEASPTEPAGFGEQLKRLREATGIKLEDISAETKISRRILQALEQGRFQFLPEQVFSRNFVRQYADVIGFDKERALRWFDAAWESYRISSGSFPALEIEAPPQAAGTPSWRFWLPVSIAVLLLVAVAITVWRGHSRGPDHGPAVSPRLESLPASPVPTLLPSPTIQPSPSPVGKAADLPDDGVVRVGVSISGGRECWIRWRDREGRTGQRLLRKGESWEEDLVGPALLTVGNAGSATLTVDGSAFEDLGRAGQVIHMEVSRDGIRRLPYRGPDD